MTVMVTFSVAVIVTATVAISVTAADTAITVTVTVTATVADTVTVKVVFRCDDCRRRRSVTNDYPRLANARVLNEGLSNNSDGNTNLRNVIPSGSITADCRCSKVCLVCNSRYLVRTRGVMRAVQVGRLAQGTRHGRSRKLGRYACVCQLSISAARGFGVNR